MTANGELVLKHLGSIHSAAVNAVRSFPMADYDDARSEAFLACLVAADRIDPERNPRNFLCARADGAARDLMRSELSMHRRYDADSKGYQWIRPQFEPITVENDEGREHENSAIEDPRDADNLVRLALKRCGVLMLGCLNEKQRRVMMLLYWHGLTAKEAAAEIGISTMTLFFHRKNACRVIAAELARRGIKSMRDVI